MDLKHATLLRQYSPVARRIALGFKRKLPPSVEADDLIAAAMCGLWDAIRLNPKPGPGFDWYVTVKMRGAILDELRRQDWLPRRHRAAVDEGKSDPVRIVFDVEENGHPASLTDFETDLSRELMARELVQHLQCLTPRERQIIISVYFREERFKDIGRRLGVSEPRVSQIHARALKKLRDLVPHSLMSAL